MDGKVIIMDSSRHERAKIRQILNRIGISEILEISTRSEYTGSQDILQDAVLVIIDSAFPYGNEGFEILSSMRKERPASALPVIITTKSAKPEHTVLALKLGAKDLIKKPYEASRLSDSVRSVIRTAPEFHYSTSGIEPVRITFDSFIKRELKIAERNKASLSIVLITTVPKAAPESPCAPPAPSEALKELHSPSPGGNCYLRASDTVFFNDNGDVLLLLPFTGKAGSLTVVERIKSVSLERLKACGISFDDAYYSIIVSYPEDGDCFQQLMECAYKRISDRQLLEKLASIPPDTRENARNRYNQFVRWF